MIGRFAGSAVLTRVPAGRVLAVAASAAALLCVLVTQAAGIPAAAAALAIGVFNSVMFPIIFTLTLERSTAPQPSTAGLLCVAIVGGAFVPLVFGTVSQSLGISGAFVVPALCYIWVVMFAITAGSMRRAQNAHDAARAMTH